jgi:26S proteasome regulatory subunit N2
MKTMSASTMFASKTIGRSSYQSALGTIPASALGLLSMLSDPSSVVRSAALRSLLKCVDTQWHEVAESLPDLEAISEDMTWSEEDRQCAAAIASRVYFHLEEPIHALRLAIVSGKTQHWAVNATRDAYTESLVRAAIQLYVQLRTGGASSSTSSNVAISTTSTSKQPKEQQSDMVDIAQLEQVVDAMLERCYADREYTHALGIALESQHEVKLQQVLSRSFSCSTDSEIQATLQYALHACVTLVSSKAFRLQALEVIAEEYSKYINSTSFSTTSSPDWSTYCKIYQMLNRPQVVANIIDTLLSNDSKKKELDILMAYQLSFDLVNSGDMGFVNRVASSLTVRDEKVLKVLLGGFSGELALSFLHKQSDTDPLIMENLKKSLDEKGGRNSVLHNCAVISHSYMNAGTTNDVFLRDHLDWMKKASNWCVLMTYFLCF